MANHDLVAIGTSAGGVEALRYLASKLPPDLPASVLVTIHLSSEFRSAMDAILTSAGPLPARFAIDGDVLTKGQIYLAPANRHLLLDGEQIVLGQGAHENNARPAIDPIRSTALCCGSRAIGGHRLLAKSWARQALEFREQAKVIRDSINQVDQIAARLERDG